MESFFSLKNPFLWVAIVFSAFYWWRCFSIFKVDTSNKNWEWKLHQRLFNALGAFIGWFAAYFLWNTDLNHFNAGHFIALIIAFLGISGYLPYAALLGKIGK